MTYFEVSIFLSLLFAMLFTNMPRKEAIVYVMVASTMCMLINDNSVKLIETIYSPYITKEHLWTPAFLVIGVQSLLAIPLILRARTMEGKDRDFFRIMAAFLFATSGSIVMFRYDIIVKFETYTAIYHVLALLQVLTVFIYSNGINQLIGSIGDSIADLRHGLSRVRG